MPNWIDERYAEERVKDLLREAAQQRLIEAALASRPQRARFCGSILARVGSWLVNWGHRLQSRYGGTAEVSIAVKASDNLPQC